MSATKQHIWKIQSLSPQNRLPIANARQLVLEVSAARLGGVKVTFNHHADACKQENIKQNRVSGMPECKLGNVNSSYVFETQTHRGARHDRGGACAGSSAYERHLRPAHAEAASHQSASHLRNVELNVSIRTKNSAQYNSRSRRV